MLALGGGIGFLSSSSNNFVTVTGTGSAWAHTADLLIGAAGSSNSLVISGGGSVVNMNAIVGNDETSSNNIATVTGTGSSWTSTGSLYVGVYASSNSLVISDGGSVSNQLDAYIGLATNSSNNSVLLTGAGSTLSNTGILYVG